MRLNIWYLAIVLGALAVLSACSTTNRYFVDIDKPRAQVVSQLQREAAALDHRATAHVRERRASLSPEEVTRLALLQQIVADLLELYLTKIEMLTIRIVRAGAMRAEAKRRLSSCRLRILKSQHSCDDLLATRAFLRKEEPRLRREIEDTEKAYRSLHNWLARTDHESELPSTDGKHAPGSVLPIGRPSSPYAGYKVTVERSREMLAPYQDEVELDANLASLEAQRITLGGQEPGRLVVTEDSFRYEFPRADGNPGVGRSEVTRTSDYQIYDVDGGTRIASRKRIDGDVERILTLKSDKACRKHDSDWIGLRICPTRADESPVLRRGHMTGYDTSRVHLSTVRSLFLGGSDPRLDAVVGYGLGIQFGLLNTAHNRGFGSFWRWNVAVLTGLQGEVMVDVRKDVEDDPRSVWSLRPELVLRVAWSRAFQLHPSKAYDIGPGPALDLAIGGALDSLGRQGIYGSASVRFLYAGGIYTRWERYRGQDGTSFVAGFDLNGALGTRSTLVGLGAVLLGTVVIGLARLCDEPHECTNDSEF